MMPASADPRQIILDAIVHLDHVLPGQAPIHDFVHHNTLHGFQHLPFEQALVEFTALTGIDCYLPAEQFRDHYRRGRISDVDLNTELERLIGAELKQDVGGASRGELYRAALLQDLSPLTPAQLVWKLSEGELEGDLWSALLAKLDLAATILHPEELLDLSSEQAESWLAAADKTPLREHCLALRDRLFDQVGDRLTLRGLLLAVTGKDILDNVRPQLIRLCASLLDEGLAAWRLPGRETLGLYQAWRQNVQYDAQAYLVDLSDWDAVTGALPDDAVDAIAQQLEAMALPRARWAGYLQRLALEIPGWSGLINWRQTHPGYHADDSTQPRLADYLALRLILDRVHAQALCRTVWHSPARFDKLQVYFGQHGDEFFVRHNLFQGGLPEYLAQAGHALLADDAREVHTWRILAERIWTWQHSPLADGGQRVTTHHHGWQLYCLCSALNIGTEKLAVLDKNQLLSWLALVADFEREHARYLWLCAYERHYREDLLQALHANRGRGRWARRDQRPQTQIVFCMDDREEGIRRHLEELNPAVETLGAAGFFGVAMNYQGLDDVKLTPLCPVVVTPSHNVRELSQEGQETAFRRRQSGWQLKQRFADWLHHDLRRRALFSYAATLVLAPFALAGLLAKSFFPTIQQRLLASAARMVAPDVPTRLQFSAGNDTTHQASPTQPRLGFTDQEQADRVAGFLRNTGLTYGFAELVVLMGHGSISQNNPHLSAYDCGACSGRHGGPNGRLFAAMANRPEVRQLLAERGIAIPDDTWFIGAEHNTGNEDIIWYDLDAVPMERQAALGKFIDDMRHAQRMSAHERCRRLASAPRRPKPAQALRHFYSRAADFSQARPELGHATNAAAFVGRRSATQGAFFDRRLFLISYDPTQDPDGEVLEGILLAVGPVGAGINLEYYFSTVNNERLGCGSKIPHNLTGFFAVMEGASSDLRTGLPRQMIEIHEAMRLQIVVEAKTQVLESIYGRQESLRELIGGGWVHLGSRDPDSGELFLFERGVGFVPWQPENRSLAVRDNSPDCYRDESQPVAPLLIRQPTFKGVQS